jgi:3',5'-cyclic AMP phosphodiesterase CpdA
MEPVMRIRILSDLHLEFYRDQPLPDIRDNVDCDVVVLAGDIHSGTKGIEWAARTFDRPVIYVLGNHEYYRQDAMKLRRDARIQAKATGVHLLERDEVRINGQRFLGCTLWTDFSLGPEPRYFAARLAETQLSDFRMIRYRRGRITVDAMSEWYRESRKWLEARLDEPDPAVVVTHFVPSPQLIHPTFGRGDQSGVFDVFLSRKSCGCTGSTIVVPNAALSSVGLPTASTWYRYPPVAVTS